MQLNCIYMELLRTPDDRFSGLPGWPYQPRYVEVPTGVDDSTLRIAYVDEGPADGSDDSPVVLAMHGEPSWSYPLSPYDPAPGRRRAASRRPGPRRVRPFRQTGRRRRPHLRAPDRLDARLAPRDSTCDGSPWSARTGEV
ncbi:MAG: hypothetical protein V9E94_11595 [Microthrixaceae bacterium]